MDVKKNAETAIITVRDIAPAQQGQETNALRIQQTVENSNLHKRKTMLDIDQWANGGQKKQHQRTEEYIYISKLSSSSWHIGEKRGHLLSVNQKTQFMKITDLGKVNRVVALTISYFCSCVLNLSYSVVQKLWASAFGRSFPSYPAFL